MLVLESVVTLSIRICVNVMVMFRIDGGIVIMASVEFRIRVSVVVSSMISVRD